MGAPVSGWHSKELDVCTVLQLNKIYYTIKVGSWKMFVHSRMSLNCLIMFSWFYFEVQGSEYGHSNGDRIVTNPAPLPPTAPINAIASDERREILRVLIVPFEPFTNTMSHHDSNKNTCGIDECFVKTFAKKFNLKIKYIFYANNMPDNLKIDGNFLEMK